MITEGFVKASTSLEETAALFHERGVDLIDYDPGNEDTLPMIRFHGDDDFGFKVVKIAKEIGLWPIDLHRVLVLPLQP